MFDEQNNLRVGRIIAVIMTVLLFLLLLLSIKTISPGEIAVAVRFGTLNGTRETGMHFAVFEGLTVYDLKIKKLEAQHETGSLDSQSIFVTTAFSYKLKSNGIEQLYSTVGSQNDLENKFILPVIKDITYQVTAQYTAGDILPKQRELGNRILAALKERMNQEYIDIVDLQIVDVDFKPEYNAALEAKQIAEQNAIKDKQVAAQDLERKKIELETTRIEAERQRLLQTSLTQQLLQKQWIEKWDGKLPQYMSGNQLPFMTIK